MNKLKPLSPIRRRYILRLILRIAVLIFCAVWLIHDPSQADILRGWNFFRRLSPFHILWVLWIVDMLWQLIPVQKNLHIALGSQKHFRFRFQPVAEKINYPALRDHIISTTKAAYKVFLIWIAVVALVSFLRYFNVLDDAALFLITIAFYVCDLICVVVWCPFRLILRTRCCTTCRIFNWDHLMMFSPMLLISGFYPRSLLIMAMVVWLIWELFIMMYPERFWEQTNEALRCANCTDRLCGTRFEQE